MKDELNFFPGKQALVSPSLSPRGRGIGNEADKYLHQIAIKTGTQGFHHMTSTRGMGASSRHESTPIETVAVTLYNVFAGDEVLESQVVLSLVYQTLRNNRDVLQRTLSCDWNNLVITADKVTVLKEISGYVQTALQLEYDLVNSFSEDMREFVGAKTNGMLNSSVTGYNVTLPMLFILLKNGLIVIDPFDAGYQSGRRILFQPYEGNQESFSSMCGNSNTIKAYCITQYWKDILNNESLTVNPSEAKVRTLTAKSLQNITGSFAVRQGYQNIYELIYSFLNLKQIV